MFFISQRLNFAGISNNEYEEIYSTLQLGLLSFWLLKLIFPVAVSTELKNKRYTQGQTGPEYTDPSKQVLYQNDKLKETYVAFSL